MRYELHAYVSSFLFNCFFVFCRISSSSSSFLLVVVTIV